MFDFAIGVAVGAALAVPLKTYVWPRLVALWQKVSGALPK